MRVALLALLLAAAVAPAPARADEVGLAVRKAFCDSRAVLALVAEAGRSGVEDAAREAETAAAALPGLFQTFADVARTGECPECEAADYRLLAGVDAEALAQGDDSGVVAEAVRRVNGTAAATLRLVRLYDGLTPEDKDAFGGMVDRNAAVLRAALSPAGTSAVARAEARVAAASADPCSCAAAYGWAMATGIVRLVCDVLDTILKAMSVVLNVIDMVLSIVGRVFGDDFEKLADSIGQRTGKVGLGGATASALIESTRDLVLESIKLDRDINCNAEFAKQISL